MPNQPNDVTNPNPYQSGAPLASSPSTSGSRWMLWAGGAALMLAGICLMITVGGMVWAFNVAESPTSAPEPSDLTSGISIALIPVLAAAPLALVGILFIVFGIVRSRGRVEQ